MELLGDNDDLMAGWYQFLAHSDHWAVRTARQGYRAVAHFSVPAPRFFFRPLLALVLMVRYSYYFLMRVFYCEPLFKAYCKSYGRNLHTGAFLHWVQGEGDLMAGDDRLVVHDARARIDLDDLHVEGRVDLLHAGDDVVPHRVVERE